MAEEGRAVSPAALTRQGKDSFPQIERVASAAEGVSSTSSTSSPSGMTAGSTAERETPRMKPVMPVNTAIDTDKLADVGLLNDKALSLPGPAYPVTWRKAVTPITVTVEVVIDETGRVIYTRAIEGPQELWRVAEDAARRAGFLPFRSEGRPFKAKGRLSYSFPFDPR